MSYSFSTRTGAGKQVRAIAKEQIEKAIALASAPEDFDKAVHALRRRTKKLRGLLRLVKPNFKDFRSENAAVRDAANLLGGARDARVMVETLDGLTVAGHTQALREFLVARADALSAGQQEGNSFEQFVGIFSDLSRRADDWIFETNGYDLVGDGLKDTYAQFVDDLENARDQETNMAMHDWRKHAKGHWYQVTLLAKAAPDVLKPREKALDQLGEFLGDHHNLAVLEETIEAAEKDFGDVEPVISAIRNKQDELARKAFGLGEQLAAEKPAALRRRFEAYWQLLPEAQ